MPNLAFSFNKPPLENLAFLMAKKPQLHFDYDEIQFEAHQRAFTVAKITKIDLLSEIKASLEDAFVEGQGYEAWAKNLKPKLQQAGWLGKEVKVINPRTNELKIIQVGASRLRKIFHTNARTAFAQSEARKGYDLPLSEYIRYTAIMDNRTRKSHALLHGKIAHKDSAFWKRNYPPNGWGCRCSVEFISKEQMQELGFKEMSQVEQKLNYAQKDWDYDTRNLQKDDNALQLIIKNKLQKHFKNTPAKEALMRLREEVRENRLRYNEMKRLWNAREKTTATLCAVPKDLKEFLNTEANAVQISSLTMQEHKQRHKEIGAFDYTLIPFLLDDSELEIYQDKSPKNPNKYIVVNRLNRWYRLSLKSLNDKKELWVESLTSSTDEKEFINNLKNKVMVWKRLR